MHMHDIRLKHCIFIAIANVIKKGKIFLWAMKKDLEEISAVEMLRYFHEWQIVEISYEQICQHIKKTISKSPPPFPQSSSLFDDMKNCSVFGWTEMVLTKRV